MNVAEFLLTIIQKLGTDTGFCLTGGMAMHINRAAAESSLRMIYCNHEQAVTAAADGYSKALDYKIPGLAIVTSGPGVTNTITSVASAYYDSVPMYILAGQVKTADINKFNVRSRGAQETPHLALMQQVTKCAFRYVPAQVNDELLIQHLSQAVAGRKGPVFVEVPLDIQALLVEDGAARVEAVVAGIQAIVRQDLGTDGAAVASIVSALATAQRPVLVVGNGVRISGVSREKLKVLLEKLEIPTLFTWASFDLLSFDHSLNFGCAGGLAPTHANRVLQNADVAVFLGTRLDLLTTAFNPQNFGRAAKRFIVEWDQAEIDKNIGQSNTTFLRENVAGVIDGLFNQADVIPKNATWVNQCKTWREDDRVEESHAFDDKRLNTYQMARVLSASPLSRYIVATGSGYAIEGLARFFRPADGATFSLAGPCLGSMGLSLPTAIGAAAALGKPVVCVEGDGGLMLNVQELLTIQANPDLPLSVIVMNNGGYQSIIQSQKRAFGKEFGASPNSGLAAIRFDLLAQVAGLSYVLCETLEQFEAAMADELAGPRRFIELRVVEDGYRGPAVSTKFTSDGIPYSTDLGDISWVRK